MKCPRCEQPLLEPRAIPGLENIFRCQHCREYVFICVRPLDDRDNEALALHMRESFARAAELELERSRQTRDLIARIRAGEAVPEKELREQYGLVPRSE